MPEIHLSPKETELLRGLMIRRATAEREAAHCQEASGIICALAIDRAGEPGDKLFQLNADLTALTERPTP